MEPNSLDIFIGIEKEPEELKPDVETGNVYIVSYPFHDIGNVNVFTYNPKDAINQILEDIGTSKAIEITTRKATLKDLCRVAGDGIL